MKTKYIVANWKENPEKIETAKKLLEISENFHRKERGSVHFAITHAVPSIFAGVLRSLGYEDIILQNISLFESGSHTGEISAKQSLGLGIQMSIVGHSETRLSRENPHGDEDKDIAIKIKNLVDNKMFALLCIGERERNENFLKTICEQLEANLNSIRVEDLDKLVIAYEPIWAIGEKATRPASKTEILETISGIKKFLADKYDKAGSEIKVLYGGSVDESNIKDILDIDVVDGVLVGRASSQTDKWADLLNKVSGNIFPVDFYQKVISGTRVLVRLDLNVPTNESGEVLNDFRIRESLDTLKELRRLGLKIIILAHKEKGSLNKIADYIQKNIFIDGFRFLPETAPKANHEYFLNQKDGEIILLENTRLDEREKSKNEEERNALAKEWSSLGELFINEAFSASHRDHASITGIPKFLPSYLGCAMEREVKNLSLALRPKHPMFLIVGGAKFDTKLPMIEKFLNIADKIFVGGALAHSFFVHDKIEIGKSLLDNEVKISEAVFSAEKDGKILLPKDVITEDNKNKSLGEITTENRIVDFGTETLEVLKKNILNSETIVWNGPVGYYEGGFEWGTQELIKFLATQSKKIVILGGGDTVTELDKMKTKYPDLKFTHVSAGGGAMIEFLSNGTLPGIKAISNI